MDRQDNDLRRRENSDQNPENNIDSPINTTRENSSSKGSLTNDESAETDPNQVPDKPGFKNSEEEINDRGRFDGNIGI